MKRFQKAAKRKMKKHSMEPSNAAVGIRMGSDAQPKIPEKPKGF